jgi:GT2 family glycosyltransferase
MKTSVVCAVKNRFTNIATAMCSWVYCQGVDEVIIVDWTSDSKFNVNYPKVKIIRVEGQQYWAASKAFNYAISQCQGDRIIRCDSDYVLHPLYLKAHPYAKNTAYSGVLTSAFDIVKKYYQWFIAGNIIVNREDFDKVGGFNELLVGYGSEDSYLHESLKLAGVNLQPVNYHMIWHLYHDMKLRDCHYPEKTNVKISYKFNYNELPKWDKTCKKWFE